MAAARAASIDRLQQKYAAVRREPQPLWTRLLRNIWSRSFYVVPLILPILVLMALWMLRPGEMGLQTFLLTWFLAAPVGFSLWIVAWKTYGAGSGQVSTLVGMTAVSAGAHGIEDFTSR